MLANRQVRDETIKTSELSNSQKGTHFVKGPNFFSFQFRFLQKSEYPVGIMRKEGRRKSKAGLKFDFSGGERDFTNNLIKVGSKQRLVESQLLNENLIKMMLED